MENDWELMSLDHYLDIHGFQMSPATIQGRNEGYVTTSQKRQFSGWLGQHPEIEAVVEIGLNGGHSADNFFHCCENLQLFVSFDICTYISIQSPQPATSHLGMATASSFSRAIPK